MSAPKIIKLDEVVINRIAAGEVVQRPANAIKEMLENCIDAGSTSIQVTVKNGGLKLIQIQDDGCGIRKDDMKIVCERFTTSKLSSFDDLKSISTYGFRGEALASISHIAHLTITTKTSDSQCAFRAKYVDGKMVPMQPGGKVEPKPVAGNKGTQITVEDLFYNVSIRRKALKNPTDEHNKIYDVISKYSIHNPSISFMLKKQGNNNADVRTAANSTTIDAIKTIYGAAVSNELLEISMEDKQLAFQLSGYISNANYSVKKGVFILFINHRLVESSLLKKSIETTYQNYLPRDTHPFVYLSLQINPMNIDVNVHPTKHEVKFLYEDDIREKIQKSIEEKLLGSNDSRRFHAQTVIPKMITVGLENPNPLKEIVSGESSNASAADKVPQKVYDHQLVRTDAKEQKMQAFFSPSSTSVAGLSKKPTSNTERPVDSSNLAQIKSEIASPCNKENVPNQPAVSSTAMSDEASNNLGAVKSPLVRYKSSLTSIRNLSSAIDEEEHSGLRAILENHKFVGCVTRSLALVQYTTRLYLLNTKKLTEEMFYQILIFQFGHFGMIHLDNPAPIHDLVMLALDCPDSGWDPADGDKNELADFVKNLLLEKAPMLLEYFSFEINPEGEITALPLLLPKYIPNWNNFPMFLLRLATEVVWDVEQKCFETFARECASFYAFGDDPIGGDDDEKKGGDDDDGEGGEDEEEDGETGNKRNWKWDVEHILFPSLRLNFRPPKTLSGDGTFLETANLNDLYKVFERC